MREPLPLGMAIPHYAPIFLRVPDLEGVPVDYVMIWTQGFGSFERRFEGLKGRHGMAAMSRDAKRSV